MSSLMFLVLFAACCVHTVSGNLADEKFWDEDQPGNEASRFVEMLIAQAADDTPQNDPPVDKNCCKTMTFTLKGKVEAQHKVYKGSYTKAGGDQFVFHTNGRARWENGKYAIWYSPALKGWAIGKSEDLGTEKSVIHSEPIGLTCPSVGGTKWMYKNADNEFEPTGEDFKIICETVYSLFG